MISDRAVLGDSDEAAHLDGYGPIPAESAREMVAGADGEATLRRVSADPGTGALVAMESRSRCFPAGLAKSIRLRDQVCRDTVVRRTDPAHRPRRTGGDRQRDLRGQRPGAVVASNHARQALG